MFSKTLLYSLIVSEYWTTILKMRRGSTRFFGIFYMIPLFQLTSCHLIFKNNQYAIDVNVWSFFHLVQLFLRFWFEDNFQQFWKVL